MESFKTLYLVETNTTIQFFPTSKEAFEYVKSLPQEAGWATVEPIKCLIPNSKGN